jgi:hypothetical protein
MIIEAGSTEQWNTFTFEKAAKNVFVFFGILWLNGTEEQGVLELYDCPDNCTALYLRPEPGQTVARALVIF